MYIMYKNLEPDLQQQKCITTAEFSPFKVCCCKEIISSHCSNYNTFINTLTVWVKIRVQEMYSKHYIVKLESTVSPTSKNHLKTLGAR